MAQEAKSGSVLGASKELEFFRTAAEDKTAFYSEDEDKPNCLFTGANYNTPPGAVAVEGFATAAGAFVVNLGHPLEIATNGLVIQKRGAPHGSRHGAGANVGGDCLLAPAEEFVSGVTSCACTWPPIDMQRQVAGSDGEAAAVLLRMELERGAPGRPPLHSPPAGPASKPNRLFTGGDYNTRGKRYWRDCLRVTYGLRIIIPLEGGAFVVSLGYTPFAMH
nr:unnamed protein product [Digitaria exilis]